MSEDVPSIPAGAGGRRFCPICSLSTDAAFCAVDRVSTLLRDAPVSDARPISAGSVIAQRYIVERAIGRGGFGAVFAARQLATGQTVALKILTGPQAENIHQVRRFFREARITSSLRHPNTVRVLDFGQDDAGPIFIAMELLTGRTLRQLLRERERSGKPLTEVEAIEIAIPITRSLGEAHALSLVHRDLKPDNIFLHRLGDDEPIVKVVDFGIAKIPDSSATQEAGHKIIGTPTYMSPEQGLGEPVDGRSDLYSLGVILYEMTAGKPPFRGERWDATIYQHIHAEPANLMTQSQRPLSPGLVALVHRCLAKKPGDRYPDAASLRADLTACLAGAGVDPTRVDVGPETTPHRLTPSRTPSGMTPSNVTHTGSSTLDRSAGATEPSPGHPGVHSLSFEGELSLPEGEDTSQGPAPGVGVVLEERYRFERWLAQGSIASIYAGVHIADGAPVTIKTIETTIAAHRAALEAEHAALARAPKLRGIPASSELIPLGAHLCLVRGFADGKPLSNERVRRSEVEVLGFASALLELVAACHEQEPPLFHGAIERDHVLRGADGEPFLIGFTGAGSAPADVHACAQIALALLPASSELGPVTHRVLDKITQGSPPRARDAAALLRHASETLRPSQARRPAEPARPELPRPEKSRGWIAGGIVVAIAVAGVLALRGRSDPTKVRTAPNIKSAMVAQMTTLPRCKMPDGYAFRARFAVLSSGHLAGVDIATEADPAPASCIAQQLRSWEFPLFSEGYVLADLPMLKGGVQVVIDAARAGSIYHVQLDWIVDAVEGDRPPAKVSEVLGAASNRVEPCFAEVARRLALADDARYPAVLRIDTSGAVQREASEAVVGVDWTRDPQLTACVTDVIRALRFEPGGPSATVKTHIALARSDQPLDAP